MRSYIKRIIHAKKMRQTALLAAALVVLGGCTRKEELLFLDEEPTLAQENVEAVSGDVQMPGAVEENSRTQEKQADEETAMPEENGLIYVHVCGAVACPGVYEMQAGSRVYEAVQAAGGFTEYADQNYVNQAEVLKDGVKLVIPTVEEAAAVQESETLDAAQKDSSAGLQFGIMSGEISGENAPGTESTDQAGSGDGRININTASEAQLCGIPGIGATRAAAIAAYREAHGGFKKPEDIMQVNGIKEGMYEKIKDSICVN